MPLPESSLSQLQQRLGYVFTDTALLQRALTHRSHSSAHNERLEFLGDAVLNLAISGQLYTRMGSSAEGDLTRVRAHLVREASLHRLALTLRLPEVLRMSDGEARGGGAQRASMLADAVEAILGAVHLDGGYEAAHAVVQRLFAPLIENPEATGLAKDAKTALQEWLQARRLPVPQYRITAAHGRAHEQVFEVQCEVSALACTAVGAARSRRAAEQVAAEKVLHALASRPDPLRQDTP